MEIVRLFDLRPIYPLLKKFMDSVGEYELEKMIVDLEADLTCGTKACYTAQDGDKMLGYIIFGVYDGYDGRYADINHICTAKGAPRNTAYNLGRQLAADAKRLGVERIVGTTIVKYSPHAMARLLGGREAQKTVRIEGIRYSIPMPLGEV